MEDRKRKAWLYTCIDAPEDTHGALKQQYEQLNAYGKQLPVEEAGCSSDVGGSMSMDRPGLKCFWREAGIREIEVLLILDSTRISRNEDQYREFIKRTKERGIEIVSVLEGSLTSDDKSLSPEVVRYIDHAVATSFGLEKVLAQGNYHTEKEKKQEGKNDSAGI